MSSISNVGLDVWFLREECDLSTAPFLVLRSTIFGHLVVLTEVSVGVLKTREEERASFEDRKYNDKNQQKGAEDIPCKCFEVYSKRYLLVVDMEPESQR